MPLLTTLALALALFQVPNAIATFDGVFKNYNRSPEEVAENRRRTMSKGRPPRPLPPGKTLEDVTAGIWPGDETDEQVREAMAWVE